MHHFYKILGSCLCCCLSFMLSAQQDSTQTNEIDTFLRKQNGLFGSLSKSILRSAPSTGDTLVKSKNRYLTYKGRTIHRVYVTEVDFGGSVNNLSQMNRHFMNRVADFFHKNTSEKVIRRNLFFKEGDEVFPYLIADNERYLRDLVFIQDAKIEIYPYDENSVEVHVITKDNFSMGADLLIRDQYSGDLTLKEENIYGTGSRIGVRFFYDERRREKVGYSVDYVQRNVKGSFADVQIGYQNIAPAFNSGRRQEQLYFVDVNRPLVSAYSQWTYRLLTSFHTNNNQYFSDSIFEAQAKYRVLRFDGWSAYNIGRIFETKEQMQSHRMQKYVAMRLIANEFLERPAAYEGVYRREYINFKAALWAFTLSKQEFFKTQYIYGFGRAEDLPEGFYASLLGGITNKAGRERGYIGTEGHYTYFTKRGHYFNHEVRMGSFLYRSQPEDMTFLLSTDYISRLYKTNYPLWNYRLFANGSFAQQAKLRLHDPLYLSSEFGLSEFGNGNLEAQMRTTARAEAAFFYKRSFWGFKFAPFVFGGLSVLTPSFRGLTAANGFSSIGGGVRCRNESLIFGTMQAKFFYFPRVVEGMVRYKILFATNLRFKYNSYFVAPPDVLIGN